jgi:hypothetical protein
MMRIAVLTLLAGWMSAGCAAPPAAEAWQPLALANADFEEGDAAANCPRGWACKMHANPYAYKFVLDTVKPPKGKRSLCVEPASKEPWAVVGQVSHDVPRGARLRFSVSLRVEGGSEKGVGPFFAAQGGSGQVVRNEQNLVQGAFEWKRVEVELDVPPDASLMEFGVVFNLPVKACMDDARLEIRRPPV